MSLRHDVNQRTVVVEEVHSSTSPSDHDRILPTRRTKRSHRSNRHDNDSVRLLLREDRDDGKKLSSLLLLTSERLDHESQRAENAERRVAAYATRLRSVLDAKDRADRDLARISEELRLYKVQLEAAQNEIFRAQDILKTVEMQRYEAELDAAKARTKARDLLEEKTIMLAREEGRQTGYQDGLRRGRALGYEEGRSAGYEDGQAYSRRVVPTQVFYENDENEDYYEERTQSPPRAERSRPSSTRSRRDRSLSEPRVASRTSAIPVPAVAIPIPPPPQIKTPPPVPVPIPSLSHSPEHIHPIPYRNSVHSPSRHSVDIPPDGWIPTADNNSFIAIPPPHELSIPVDANPTPRSNARSLDGNETVERASVRRPASRQQHPQVHSRDYAYTDASAPRPVRPPSRPRSSSGASRGSTRISQYDLVSAPRNERSENPERNGDVRDVYSVRSVSRRGRERDRDREDSRERSRTPGLDSSRGRRSRPESERIAEEWRSANPDVVAPHNSTRMSNDHASSQQRQFYQQGPLRVRGTVEVTAPFTVAQRVANLTRPPPATIVRRPKSPVVEWLFGKRTNDRASSSPPPISVQPPSESASENSQLTLVHPGLLSPEDANRPLPDESGLSEGFPPAVVSKVDIPSVYLPKDPEPLPIGVEQVLPVPAPDAPGASPRPGPSYALAPIPPGVVYPDPPTRPATAAGFSRPPSRAEGGDAVRRRGQSLNAGSPAPLQRPISIFSD